MKYFDLKRDHFSFFEMRFHFQNFGGFGSRVLWSTFSFIYLSQTKTISSFDIMAYFGTIFDFLKWNYKGSVSRIRVQLNTIHVYFPVKDLIRVKIQHFLYRSWTVLYGFIYLYRKLYKSVQDLYKKCWIVTLIKSCTGNETWVLF